MDKLSTSANSENIFPQDLRMKPLPPKTKRVALSTINENIQPRKPYTHLQTFSKPGLTTAVSRNADFPLLKPEKPFVIFEEKQEEPKQKKNETISLPENVTRLFKPDSQQKLPISFQSKPISFDSSGDDSTMDLDSFETSKDCIRDDLFFCTPYVSSIYDHLRKLEKTIRPSPNYMWKQQDISSSMRSILVDWLVEVTEEYKMQTETLYLAVSYTDRFLSVMSVLKTKLQLVGTASMFIASKFEEIYPPELKEFVYITDDTYSKNQVLRMEHLILKVLSFDLTAPTAYTFLQFFCSIMKAQENIRCLAEYICELSLLEDDPFLSFLPSEIAGASLCLANLTLKQVPWSSDMMEATGYVFEDFKACITCLHKKYSKADMCPQKAVRDKYKSAKYHCTANIPAPERLMY